jgi:hypothetical protein
MGQRWKNRKYFELKKIKTKHQNVWDITNTMLRERERERERWIAAVSIHIREEKRV